MPESIVIKLDDSRSIALTANNTLLKNGEFTPEDFNKIHAKILKLNSALINELFDTISRNIKANNTLVSNRKAE